MDQSTNNFSLFELIEKIGIDSEVLGKALTLEVHIYWQIDSSVPNTAFEIRLVRVAKDGTADTGGNVLEMNSKDKSRMRMRAHGFMLPKAYGEYQLFAEWRKKGDENWTRDPAVWPIIITPPNIEK